MDEFSYIERPFVIFLSPPALFLKEVAYRYEEMPEGMTSAAQMFFQKARCLYRSVTDAEQGEREMAEIARAYEADKQDEARCYEISQLWPRTEKPARDYTFSAGTPEGDAFYAAVYRMPKDWRLRRNEALPQRL